MSDTNIGWTDKVWSASIHVVACHEPAWATAEIVLPEELTAPTGAGDLSISLSRLAPIESDCSLNHSMMGDGFNHIQILRTVVGLVAVQVMDLFSDGESSADLLFGDQPMFVDVASGVSKMMPGHLQQNVAIRGDCSAALPVGVLRTALNDSHGYRITRGVS